MESKRKVMKAYFLRHWFPYAWLILKVEMLHEEFPSFINSVLQTYSSSVGTRDNGNSQAEREYVQNQIQDLQPFTLGELSEEAMESLNKTVRRFRQDRTRKTSRITTNFDLFHSLFLASDPLISNLRELPKKKRTQLPLQVLQLLSTPEGPNSEDSRDCDSEDE
ncbi:hypothetical protein ANN_27715 [Periplaneta americana]|uniref:Uncharacterized protein n=1 Tax=Periplaneta americana TaxID=6978 RepID=A0ABQ8RV28_PERAM|nr:hypothetical protein ANN_27715 [Periplaneta americana]